jgi:putative salt-induced outer membrane protein YdiY
MPLRTSHKAQGVGSYVLLLLIILLGAGWEPSLAQHIVLQLRNGDRLTGRLISETTNEVVLATAYAERLTIGTELIDKRESLPLPALSAGATTNQVPNAPATTSASTNKPAAAPLPNSRAPTAPASGIVSELVLTNKPSLAQSAGGAAPTPPAPPKPPEPSAWKKFIDEWRGEAQLGANLGFSTKDRQAFTGHIKLTHNHAFPNTRSLRNILDYDVAYGITESVLSDNRMEGALKTEYDLNRRLLVYGAAGAGYNEIRGIDLQYDLGPGLGYKWVVLTNFVFKNELGGDYQEQFFVGNKHTSRYSLRLAEDLWWQITPKMRFDQKLEFFPEVRDVANYRVRFESNLSYLLKQNLTLTLSVVDLYDTAVPAGISKNDLQVRSLLGIKF